MQSLAHDKFPSVKKVPADFADNRRKKTEILRKSVASAKNI
jgi:hypothetical protein